MSNLLSVAQNLECIREVGSAATELLFYAKGLPWCPCGRSLQLSSCNTLREL
jgi:hypothetical protein